MASILITLPNGVLRVEDSATVSIDLQNPIFLVDGAVLPGSYSFPFSVTLGNEERKLLGYPDRKDRADNIKEFKSCTLFYDGVPLFYGSILVLGSTEKQAKLSFIINAFDEFENFNIRELDLGEVNVGGGAFDMVNHMKDTAMHPEDHNHVFTPVFNPSYFDTDYKDSDFDGAPTITEAERWNRRIQNFYNPDTNRFEGLSATPFVKLHEIIVKSFERFGVVLDDQFFDEELKRIYLYNNISVSTNSNSLAGTWSISDYLPYAKAVDALKEMRKTFCLAILPDPFNKKVTLKPIRDIINGLPVRDWTAKEILGYENILDDILPEQFGYDDDISEDGALDYFDEQQVKGLDYFLNTNMYYNNGNLLDPFAPFVLKMAIVFQSINTTGKVSPFLSKMVPLLNSNGSFVAYINRFLKEEKLVYDEAPYTDMPMIDVGGSINYSLVEGEITQKESKITSLRTIFYRGFRNHKPYFDGPTVSIPYAQAGEYDPAIVNIFDLLGTYPESVDNYSLLWNGPKGLYEVWFKEYINMLEEQKISSIPFRLTLSDVLNFRYEDKVRVQNNDYLVKTLRLNLGNNGITAQATMIRTS